MNTPTRLAAFAAALVVVFAIAFAIGRLTPDVGRDDAPAPTGTVTHDH